MKIGFALPQAGAVAWQAPEVERYAREVEDLGGDSLWVIDRLLAPVNPQGDAFPEEYRAVLDPFILLGVAAAATERVLVGGNVLTAPWYSPTVLARSLTTLDVLSGGRLVPGFGVGWSPDEYVAAGIPMKERGARLDETLDALEQLWTADPAEYHGRYWHVPAAHVPLKPVRRPPIYLAGLKPAAMRRVALRADGWLPFLGPPVLVDIDALVNRPLREIREMAAEAGRDPAALDTILRFYPRTRSEKVVDEVVEWIKRVEDQTVIRHVIVDLMYLVDDVDDMLRYVDGILSDAR